MEYCQRRSKRFISVVAISDPQWQGNLVPHIKRSQKHTHRSWYCSYLVCHLAVQVPSILMYPQPPLLRMKSVLKPVIERLLIGQSLQDKPCVYLWSEYWPRYHLSLWKRETIGDCTYSFEISMNNAWLHGVKIFETLGHISYLEELVGYHQHFESLNTHKRDTVCIRVLVQIFLDVAILHPRWYQADPCTIIVHIV